MARVQLEVEAGADGVFVYGVVCRQLINIVIGVCRCSRQQKGLGSVKCVDDLLDRRHCLAFCKRARSSFNQVDAVAEPVSLVASKEKYFVLHEGTANRTAELIHSQRQPRFPAGSYAVEEIAGIQTVIPQKLEHRSVKGVAAGFCDDADLAPAARSKLCAICVRFDPKLLHIFQAALKLERGCQLSTDYSWRCIYDAGGFYPVETKGILLGRTAIESNIAVLAVAGVLCSWRLQIQLRQLPAVNWERRHFARVHICAHGGIARLNADFCRVRRNSQLLGDAGGFECQIDRESLSDIELNTGNFCFGKSGEAGSDGIKRWLQRHNEIVAFFTRQRHTFLTSPIILHADLDSRNHGAGLIFNSSRNASLIDLRHRRNGKSADDH